MRRFASRRDRTHGIAVLAVAALVSVCGARAGAERVRLGGEGPLLPRPSGPRSSPQLVPSTDEAVPPEQPEVLEPRKKDEVMR